MKKGFTLAEVLTPKRTSGAENEVICSRESKEQAPLSLNRKLVAFTLAEVLITLVVIGVVAALTIPIVAHKYQQNVFYTQFMKVYNTVQNAMLLAISQYGNPSNWYDNTSYITSNMNIISECHWIRPNKSDQIAANPNTCANYDIFKLSGGRIGQAADYLTVQKSIPASGRATTSNVNTYTLADGAIVSIASGPDVEGIPQMSNKYIKFAFDTNGAKGPNVVGRDLFAIIFNFSDSKFGVESAYTLENNNAGPYHNETVPSNCDPASKGSNGYGCADRLLKEGKMNY